MSPEIKIREANDGDMTSLASLSGELGYETTSTEIKARLARIFEDPAHMVFVAVSPDDNVLGWIHVYTNLRLMNDPSAELGGLIVTECFRNQGIGKLLLSNSEDWAKEHGCKLFIVRTRSIRVDAHHFYEQAEYKFWKEHKVFRKNLK